MEPIPEDPPQSKPEVRRQRLSREQAEQELQRFYAVLGRVVLLALPGDINPTKQGWQNITFEQSKEEAYQKMLVNRLMQGRNIGVRFGPLSDGLRGLDIDLDGRLEGELERNPELRGTAIRYGARGCLLLFRFALGAELPHKNAGIDYL
jgi:hypothetical protein